MNSTSQMKHPPGEVQTALQEHCQLEHLKEVILTQHNQISHLEMSRQHPQQVLVHLHLNQQRNKPKHQR